MRQMVGDTEAQQLHKSPPTIFLPRVTCDVHILRAVKEQATCALHPCVKSLAQSLKTKIHSRPRLRPAVLIFICVRELGFRCSHSRYFSWKISTSGTSNLFCCNMNSHVATTSSIRACPTPSSISLALIGWIIPKNRSTNIARCFRRPGTMRLEPQQWLARTARNQTNRWPRNETMEWAQRAAVEWVPFFRKERRRRVGLRLRRPGTENSR
ncbi:hypothetical protein B0H19DRAFT_533548 [Mycena capillaripes]|nr:hypothetical protein B0H19DRAFT_533548 [Mycena capillaripes]